MHIPSLPTKTAMDIPSWLVHTGNLLD